MHAFLFLKSPLLSGMDQKKQVYCNNDKGRIYQDFEFQYPGAGIIVQGHGSMPYTVVKM